MICLTFIRTDVLTMTPLKKQKNSSGMRTQAFLGCEILALIDFLKERGLLYAYLRYKYSEPLTEEEELPF